MDQHEWQLVLGRAEQNKITRPQPEISDIQLGDTGGLSWISGLKKIKIS
jgi:hypothetical protein